MAWPEKLKLSKQVMRSVTEQGFTEPKEVQFKTLPRIFGGQDIIVSGPEGCGKTTAYVLAVLNRIKYDPEGIPDVLILVPDKESVLAVISRFEMLNSNKPVSIVGLYAAPGTESQMNALADGADIVVATPDRARAIYLKLGLNLNKISLFIVDDAELIVKQGLQLPVAELANSITKCQHLVFTRVIHEKLNKMIAPFMKLPAIVEVEETGDAKIETYPQVLYHVPDFGTKLNLLNLFMEDGELFTKTVVFVNTHQTAGTVYKMLQVRPGNGAVLVDRQSAIVSIEEFKGSQESRVLIIAQENNDIPKLDGFPFIIHFDVPAERETFIRQVEVETPGGAGETLSIIFATDLELSLVKGIEQAIGHKIPVAELPPELVLAKEKKAAVAAGQRHANKNAVPQAGEAFHEKKASNSKTYNYSSGLKAKMNNKRKH